MYLSVYPFIYLYIHQNYIDLHLTEGDPGQHTEKWVELHIKTIDIKKYKNHISSKFYKNRVTNPREIENNKNSLFSNGAIKAFLQFPGSPMPDNLTRS